MLFGRSLHRRVLLLLVGWRVGGVVSDFWGRDSRAVLLGPILERPGYTYVENQN
jgi:hypothetical protein